MIGNERKAILVMNQASRDKLRDAGHQAHRLVAARQVTVIWPIADKPGPGTADEIAAILGRAGRH
jgi:hypothetical protein